MKRYQEIKELLTAIAGRMNPGDRLPSRPALCKQLDTTRTTLDRAVKELIAEGILTSRNGSGTYAVGLIDGKAPYTENWCVIVPNVMQDIYPSLIRGIENVAMEHNANVILCNSDNDPVKQDRYIRRLLVSGVSGFIIVPAISGTLEGNYQLYRILQDSNIPFVFCNRGIDGIHAPVVKSNDFYGGYIATKHLLKHGYRHIAYVAATSYQTSVERCQGYVSALLEQGIPVNRHLIILPGNDHPEDPYSCMEKLLNGNVPVDAVFCFNDRIGTAVCRAIRDAGKQVSGDIGVIGYDNSSAASACDPPLSSVAYRSMEIGEKAASILSDLIQGKPPASNFSYYLFQPSIVERDSCKSRNKEESYETL